MEWPYGDVDVVIWLLSKCLTREGEDIVEDRAAGTSVEGRMGCRREGESGEDGVGKVRGFSPWARTEFAWKQGVYVIFDIKFDLAIGGADQTLIDMCQEFYI